MGCAQRPLQALERHRDFGHPFLVVGLGIGVGGSGHGSGEGRHIVGPGTVHRALDRVLGVQTGWDGFIEIFGDGVRFEQ